MQIINLILKLTTTFFNLVNTEQIFHVLHFNKLKIFFMNI